MLEGLKPLLSSILRPLVRPALALGIRPNHLTVAGVALFAAASWLAWTGKWGMACIVTVAGSLLDGLDGLVARESNQKSAFGAILDSTGDRCTEILLLFGIFGRYLTFPASPAETTLLAWPLHAWGILFCFSAVTMSLMVSYVKARCEGAGIPCRRGFLQRPERIILLCAGLLGGCTVMVLILAAVSLLGAFTAGQRLVEAFVRTKRRAG